MPSAVLRDFLQRFAQAPHLDDLSDALAKADNNIVISGVRGGAFPALLALLCRRRPEPDAPAPRPLLVVTSSLERAESITDGLAFFGADPLLFPGYETLPFETVEPALHITAARWRALARLVADPIAGTTAHPPMLIVPVDALAFRTPPADGLRSLIVDLKWGQSVRVEELAARLVAMGYRRESLVEAPGEFAIRGSIVDLFPPDVEWPWRLDLFGNEIEQIRRFDPTTQRSLPTRDAKQGEVEIVRLLPAASHAPALEILKSGRALGSLLDLLPADTVVIRDGAERVEQRLLHFNETAARHWQEASRPRRDDDESGFFARHKLSSGDWLLSIDEIHAGLDARQWINLADLGTDFGDEDDREATGGGLLGGAHGGRPPGHRQTIGWRIPTQSFEAIPSQFPQYLGLFRERLRKGHWVVVVCDNNGQVMRLEELLRENEVPVLPIAEAAPADLPRSAAAECRHVLLTIGQLHEGFHCPQAGVFIVTDREMFGRYKRRHIYRKASRGKAIANPNEIERGDFAVHVLHGIGHFEGIRRQFVDGRTAEFLELTYQDGDKLLVPVDKLHLVQKYAGADGKEPTLDKLGSKKWQKRCMKSMEAVRKMAGELLELYARRAGAFGFAYGPDSVWQSEFEASFLYQETPDQLTAIEQVKQDMETPKPMDRLVCGDVGYGKTEVAIRAAFKALVEGRQIALLAPTTLLVQQHFGVFSERFADFPFKLGVLSRFVTPAKTRETIDGLASGEVQMVVGTHRLLSKDIRFKDLGLLIVDEEQRFGVAQKEKIKSLRTEVDILTLTATPIPRTLYLALSGLRDLSIITTPPADRLPIKTRTIRMDREILEEALLRELNRGGQIYVIHNRIQSIQEMAQTIREIVPRARIAVAHGQMDERDLEKIMLDFIAGKHDVLVSTTIIENGIDIPNVNTIIVNRADAFGLSQLYQLRGRVGRDVRQAYAYLILPPGQAITPAAIKRLEALEEFTDLGVGFSIAMRDLEIRGTGNILGREQHGAINDIGYEMYCRMLEEAVQDLKGDGPLEPLWPTEIKWPVDQLLTEEYIPVESQRIRFYKDIAAARTLEQIEEWRTELLDRYGELPPPTHNLLNAARLKLAGAAWRVDTLRLIAEPREEDTRPVGATARDAAGRNAAGRPSGSAQHEADGEPLWREVRVKAPVSHIELAVGLAETAAAGRTGFTRLRRTGDTLILIVRDDDPPLTAPKLLSICADWFESLPAFELPPEKTIAPAPPAGI
jgi:transcription-repair coupling factor (superfamily II helicase)